MAYAKNSHRIPSDEVVEKLYLRENLNYSSETNTAANSFFKMIIEKISEFFNMLSSPLDKLEFDSIPNLLVSALLIILLMIVILFMYKILRKIWFTYSPGSMNREIINSTSFPIHKSDEYLQLYENSYRSSDNRFAMRYLYLFTLSSLADAGILSLRKDKTNRAYLSEINESYTREIFSKIAGTFDYVWYGDKKITTKETEELKELSLKIAGTP